MLFLPLPLSLDGARECTHAHMCIIYVCVSVWTHIHIYISVLSIQIKNMHYISASHSKPIGIFRIYNSSSDSENLGILHP